MSQFNPGDLLVNCANKPVIFLGWSGVGEFCLEAIPKYEFYNVQELRHVALLYPDVALLYPDVGLMWTNTSKMTSFKLLVSFNECA